MVESISEGQSGEDMSSEEHSVKHSNSKKWAGYGHSKQLFAKQLCSVSSGTPTGHILK